MSMKRLPYRRPTVREIVTYHGEKGEQRLFVDYGIDRNMNKIGEVFIRPAGKTNAWFDRLLDDVGVLISTLLQSGFSCADVYKRLGWPALHLKEDDPSQYWHRAVSLIAHVLHRGAQIEAEHIKPRNDEPELPF